MCEHPAARNHGSWRMTRSQKSWSKASERGTSREKLESKDPGHKEPSEYCRSLDRTKGQWECTDDCKLGSRIIQCVPEENQATFWRDSRGAAGGKQSSWEAVSGTHVRANIGLVSDRVPPKAEPRIQTDCRLLLWDVIPGSQSERMGRNEIRKGGKQQEKLCKWGWCHCGQLGFTHTGIIWTIP